MPDTSRTEAMRAMPLLRKWVSTPTPQAGQGTASPSVQGPVSAAWPTCQLIGHNGEFAASHSQLTIAQNYAKIL
jgi:hypothetical protein